MQDIEINAFSIDRRNLCCANVSPRTTLFCNHWQPLQAFSTPAGNRSAMNPHASADSGNISTCR